MQSSAKKVRVGLVGITGYTGMELARLLAVHPVLHLVAATSRSEAGKTLGDVYPFVKGFSIANVVIKQPDPDYLAEHCDLVFLAVPHGTAMEMAGVFRSKGLRVVDLSADFRLRDSGTYATWYNLTHSQPKVLSEAIYGLVELYADEIKGCNMVANPGCYPTASILGLYPALSDGFIETDGIVIDAKSGTSGAGRKNVTTSLFCEVHDSFRPYGLVSHRHTPEIEQELSLVAGEALTVSFNPHLLPIHRGILATIYTKLKENPTENTLEKIHEAYHRIYSGHRFIRVLPLGSLPELRNVRGTMFCDLALALDPRTKRLIIISAIDNLCRGASGQAVANANLMFGLPMETGLELPPLLP